VSDRTWREVEIEIDNLRRLLSTHSALLDRCRASTPSSDELLAVAAILHSFYTGIERILKRLVTVAYGEHFSGGTWHIDLLNLAASPTLSRSAIISGALHEVLGDYLAFRHVFRHAYSFDLSWAKMEGMVSACTDVLHRFASELETYRKNYGGD
jgi:hypothetical protein